MLELADASELLNRPLAGFFDGEIRAAAEAAMARRARRARPVSVPDADGVGRAEVVGRRA